MVMVSVGVCVMELLLVGECIVEDLLGCVDVVFYEVKYGGCN